MNDAKAQPGLYEKPRFSPGCFGTVLAYRVEDELCNSCDFRDRCKIVHEVAKVEFKAYFAGREHTIGDNYEAHQRRIRRMKAKGVPDAAAICTAVPPRARADLSGMTSEERADYLKEQARLRKARQRAKKAEK